MIFGRVDGASNSTVPILSGDLNHDGALDIITEGFVLFNEQELSPTTRLTYDGSFNQLTSVTDELDHQTLFDVDPANGNRLSTTEVIGAVGGGDDLVTQYTYTTEGLIDTMTDPLRRVANFDYDALGRLTLLTLAVGTADETTQGFEYDDTGNQTAVIDGNNNRTEFEYDMLCRKAGETTRRAA